MRHFWLAAVVLAVMGGEAQAQGRPPQAVMNRVTEMDALCREVGGRTGDRTGLLQAVDLNGDGQADWILNETVYQCEGAASLFSGSGGGQIWVFPGQGQGHVGQPFSQAVLELEVEQGTAWATVGGGYCGQDTSGLSRAEMTICRLPIIWNASAGRFELQEASGAAPSSKGGAAGR